MRSMNAWVWVAIVGALSGCGNGGGGSGDACTAYVDVAAASDVVIRIVNHRSTEVYVDTECGVAFDVEAGGVTHPGGMSAMQSTCFALQSEQPHCCDCASSGTAIPPGGTWETHWSGLFYDTTEMPAACYGSPPEGQTAVQPAPTACAQPTAATAGPMRLLPHVYATSTSHSAAWPSVSDPIKVEKDFVLGTDGVVEVIVP